MPRYYFHVTEGLAMLPDELGTELPDLAAVRSAAITACGEMLKDIDGQLPRSGEWRMDVTDEAGTRIMTFRFAEER